MSVLGILLIFFNHYLVFSFFFFFQAEDGIRDDLVTGVQTCALPILIAAVEGDRAGLVAEAADVLYHLLVVLRSRDVPLDAVMNELERRTAQSGLAEKASRPR